MKIDLCKSYTGYLFKSLIQPNWTIHSFEVYLSEGSKTCQDGFPTHCCMFNFVVCILRAKDTDSQASF